MGHKLFATSLLATCLATTTMLSGHAMAKDPEHSFYPKLKWTVEQVNAGGADNLPSCVLSNQLNNGYIIQLAGTTTGFSNLNLDFRQDSFETNRKYEVTYSVPGVIEKTIPTKAFKNSLLVSDLRSEESFVTALNTASVLDVTIRNTEFRLYLTGLEAAMQDYNSCIDPQGSLAAAKETVQEIPQQPKIVEGAMAPPPPLNVSFSTQDTKEPHTAKAAPSKAPTYKTDKPRYTDLLAQQLKEESEKYKPTLSNSDVDDVDRAKAVETIEPEASSLSTPMPRLHAEHIEAPQAQQVAANQSTAQRLAAIEPATGESTPSRTNSKISALEEQIRHLTNKNKMMDEELKIALKDSVNERASISSNDWNLEKATMKFNEAERQITRLGRQLQTHKAQCQVEKDSLEHMLFDPQLTSQQQLASLASLESELDKAKADFYRKQRQYEERIRILEQQLNAQ